jgi:hypothetical protein
MEQDEKSPASAEARWRKWSEQEARSMLEELASSGESALGFSKRKGVSAQRIGYWKKRLACLPPVVAFKEVSFAALPLSTARIEITVGVVQIRVREDLSVEHLARLVGALALQSRTC